MQRRKINNLEQDIPVDLVLGMRRRGKSDREIIQSLQQQNFDSQQISDAMNQVDIKKNVGVPLPSPVDSEGYAPLNVPLPPAPYPEPEQDYFPTPSAGFSTQAPSYQESSFQEPEPSFTQPFGMNRGGDIERVEELAESIIREKWDELTKDVGDIRVWKENVKIELVSIKQEIIRTQERFENLQNAILAKVQEYSRNIDGVNAELKAMEKVLEKILEPFSKNIKELSKITAELKKK